MTAEGRAVPPGSKLTFSAQEMLPVSHRNNQSYPSQSLGRTNSQGTGIPKAQRGSTSVFPAPLWTHNSHRLWPHQSWEWDKKHPTKNVLKPEATTTFCSGKENEVIHLNYTLKSAKESKPKLRELMIKL